MAVDAILVRKPVRAADGRVRVNTYVAAVLPNGSFEKLAKRK